MQKIIWCKGLQGAGKSTWAIKKCQEDNSFKRVNKDDIRAIYLAAVNKKWNKTIEKEIVKIQNNDILHHLKSGYNVIIDNTHLNPIHRENIQKFISDRFGEVEWEDKYFDVLLPEAIERDSKRSNPFGADVILKTFKQYLWTERKINPSLDDIIWVDMDGTLALYGNKNPYERDFENDDINMPVFWILRQWFNNGQDVYFMTGRKEKYREQTMEFLTKKCGFSSDRFKLLMRQDDGIKDYVVKYKLYKEYIENKVNVFFAIDDRKMIKYLLFQLGIPCFDVNYGDLIY